MKLHNDLKDKGKQMKSWEDIRELWHKLPTAPQFRDVDRSCFTEKLERRGRPKQNKNTLPQEPTFFFSDDLPPRKG